MMNKKIIFTIILILFSHSAITESLLPLTQVFNIGKNETVQGSFTINEPDFTVYVVGVDSDQVVLTLPNGKVVTESSAAAASIDWSTETIIGRETMLIIASSNAVAGDYLFKATARPQVPGSFAVQQSPGLKYRMFVGSPGTTNEPGQPFGISTALFYNNKPATGGIVTVDMLDSVGAVSGQLLLRDDGQSPDITANDGMYTSVTTLSNSGAYSAVLSVSWRGHKGLVSTPFFIRQKRIALSGAFSSMDIDSDQDGEIEGAVLTFPEKNARLPGAYELIAEITDATGVSVSETAVIDDVNKSLSTYFSVKELRKLGAQPWQVSSVSIWLDSQVMDVLEDLGELIIDPSTFVRDAMIVGEVSGDRGVDGDGDGLYESFEVDIQVETKVAGDYGLSSDLRSNERTLLSSEGISRLSLVKGINTITLTFSGGEIGSAGKDGPFLVTNFLIYPNFKSTEKVVKLVDLVGQTSAYTCEQFTGCGVDRAAEIRRIAKLLCGKYGHELLKKLKKIERFAQKHPKAAKQLLAVLYHYALKLKKHASCLSGKNKGRKHFGHRGDHDDHSHHK